MRIEHFTNRRTGTHYNRITKNQAKKLFADGYTILIAPIKANMHCIFQTWAIMQYNGIDGTTPEQDFERISNSFAYYNCNNEMGTYCKYFAPASVIEQHLSR